MFLFMWHGWWICLIGLFISKQLQKHLKIRFSSVTGNELNGMIWTYYKLYWKQHTYMSLVFHIPIFEAKFSLCTKKINSLEISNKYFFPNDLLSLESRKITPIFNTLWDYKLVTCE